MNLRVLWNKRALVVLFLILGATISASAIVPLWGDFLTSIGGTLKDAGTAVAILNMGTAICTAIMAFFETKYAKRLTLFTMGAFLILGVAYFGYIFVTNVTELYITLIILSIGNGMLWPTFNAIYQTTFEEENSALFWAIFNLSYDLSSALGSLIGSHMVSNFGFTMLFLVISITCFVCFFFSLFSLPKKWITESK